VQKEKSQPGSNPSFTQVILAHFDWLYKYRGGTEAQDVFAPDRLAERHSGGCPRRILGRHVWLDFDVGRNVNVFPEFDEVRGSR